MIVLDVVAVVVCLLLDESLMVSGRYVTRTFLKARGGKLA